VAHPYGAVLSVAGAPRLLSSSVLARLPLGMTSLAILLLVRAHTGSFAAAGAAVGAFALAGAAAAPVQGALADRRGQVRILVPAAIAQSALLVALVVAAHAGAGVPVLVALAALAGALVPPVAACLRALWPAVAPDPSRREAAYSLDAVTQETCWTLGPLLVGGIVAILSPEAAVGLCATITLVGTLAFVSSPLARRTRPAPTGVAGGGALSSAGLRLLLLTGVLMGIGIGSIEVGLPALAIHVGAAHAAGALLAVSSLGSMAGGLAYGARTWRRPPERRYAILLGAIPLLSAPLLLVHSLGVGLALSVIAGLAYAPALSCQMLLVAGLAPAGAVTEAYTWNSAAITGGVAGGSALAGVLVEAAGSSAPFVLGCCGGAAAAAIAARGRMRLAG
jgi:MFS family permease